MKAPAVRTSATSDGLGGLIGRAREWQRFVRPPRLGLSARPRLLPILIFVASLFLSVKIGLIWRDSGNGFGAGAIAISGAQAGPAEPASATSAEPAPRRGTDADTAAGRSKALGGAGASPAKGKASESRPNAAAPAGAAATEKTREPEFSPAEVEVLRQLAGRRAALDARSRELDKRDAVLRAAEQRLDAKAQALKDLQTRVAALLRQHDAEQDAKMASLAKLYESMKPKDAAAILQTIETDTLLRVVERIRERKLAAIMAEMNTDRARDVTMELIHLRAIDAGGAARSSAPKPGRSE